MQRSAMYQLHILYVPGRTPAKRGNPHNRPTGRAAFKQGRSAIKKTTMDSQCLRKVGA
jgi:hypothetical protein